MGILNSLTKLNGDRVLINIVLSDRGWILEKLANEICKIRPSITISTEPDPTADVQYYITYGCRKNRVSPIEIAYFAHLEPEGEARDKFFSVAKDVDMSVCHAKRYADMLCDAEVEGVVTIPPGVDAEEFQPKLRVGVVGRTYHTGRKGEHIVDELSDLDFIDWHFTGQGWPEQGTAVDGDDLADFYRSMDYILVPALYEGGPMSVVEALACGVEVIAPDVGWVPTFPHIPYDLGDAASLRGVMQELFEKKNSLHQSILSFNWENWAVKNLEVIDRLVKENADKIKPARKKKRLKSSVGVRLHGAENKSLGGPSVRAPRMVFEMKRSGMDVSCAHFPSEEVDRKDIRHVFNVWTPERAVEALYFAKFQHEKTVFSPIFLNLSARDFWEHKLLELYEEGSVNSEDIEQAWSAYNSQKHGDDEIEEIKLGYFDQIKKMARLSDHLILLSELEKQSLSQIGVDVEQSTIVHNPVDVHLYKDGNGDAFKQAYNIDDFVLCVGRIEPRKNQLLLIEALRDTDIPLVFVGHFSSPRYEAIIRSVASENVYFIDRLDPNGDLLRSAYKACKVFSLPSWSEGAPLVALEAAASGCTMVLSSASSEQEYFGDYAKYCDPHDVVGLKQAILSAYNEDYTEEYKKELQQYVAQHFSWEAHVDATAKVYKTVEKLKSPNESDAAALSSTTNKPIYVDVTTSANHKGQLTGISRVEMSVAQSLENTSTRPIQYFCWCNERGAFFDVPKDVVDSNTVPKYLQKMKTTLGDIQTVPCEGADYIVMGSGWMQNQTYAMALVRFVREHSLNFSFLVHDLIPMKFPHWFPGGYANVFLENLEIMTSGCHKLIAISQSTRKDIRAFYKTRFHSDKPVHIIREGDEISSQDSQGKGLVLSDEENLLNKGYVLCVGSIHPRKNQKLLVDIWRMLAEDKSFKLPYLVIVGGLAWQAEELLNEIEWSPILRQHIKIMRHVDDAGLQWLYEHCLFTAYPSYYEGWGLPIVESLNAGKLCLASNSSSMVEIAPDLVEHIDPYDFKTWEVKIRMYCNSQQARHAKEEKIANEYAPRSWDETARELSEILDKGNHVHQGNDYLPSTLVDLSHYMNASRYLDAYGRYDDQTKWFNVLGEQVSFRCQGLNDTEETLLFMARIKLSTSSYPVRVPAYVNGSLVDYVWFFDDKSTLVNVKIPSSMIKNGALITSLNFSGMGYNLCKVSVKDFCLGPLNNARNLTLHFLSEDEMANIGRHEDLCFSPEVANKLFLNKVQTDVSWGCFSENQVQSLAIPYVFSDEDYRLSMVVRPVAKTSDPVVIKVLVNGKNVHEQDYSNSSVQALEIDVASGDVTCAYPATIEIQCNGVKSCRDLGLGHSPIIKGVGLMGLSLQLANAANTIVHSGESISFSKVNKDERVENILARGWYQRDEGGVWSAGYAGGLRVRFNNYHRAPTLTLSLICYGATAERPVNLSCIVNGLVRIETCVVHGYGFEVEIPEKSLDRFVGQNLDIRFETEDGMGSSFENNAGGDERDLGIFLMKMEVN